MAIQRLYQAPTDVGSIDQGERRQGGHNVLMTRQMKISGVSMIHMADKLFVYACKT